MRTQPLEWPPGWERTRRDHKRHGSRFTHSGKPVPRDVALDMLATELDKLGAERVVITADRYGEDEGVAVYFNLNGEQRVMACDRCNSQAANMRSLGLAVEAMRQLQRHGGGAMMDRALAGFTALPPPRSCWEVLGIEPGSDHLAIERAFRAKALKHHPDRGGSDGAMAELNAARHEAIKRTQSLTA